MFNERLVLRFGSATHEAWVYINGKEITHHKGGFTPFEVEINNFLKTGKNLLIVKLSNILDYTTLPVGNYSETVDANGKKVRKVDKNFDFSPANIIEELDLLKPMYRQTACYGHFGREGFTWEKIKDKVK